MNHSRTRRVCKWVGTILCVLIGAAFAHYCISPYYWQAELPFHVRLRFHQAAINISHCPLPPQVPGQVDDSRVLIQPPMKLGSCSVEEARALIASLQHERLIWWPRAHVDWPSWSFEIPLWVTFVACAAPTGLMWWRDRLRRRPGFCERCGYDLTGNVSGRCPECGGLIAAGTG
ncbi:MAG: hypothetical protein KA383_18400 [Phycisphaerae bacterium]|nr:hypothetical protein [Phycisphaerae bacterium]